MIPTFSFPSVATPTSWSCRCVFPQRTWSDSSSWYKLKFELFTYVFNKLFWRVQVFEKGLEVTGISADFWPAPVYQASVERGRHHTLGMTKHSQYLDHKNSFCLPGVSREESVGCLVREAR